MAPRWFRSLRVRLAVLLVASAILPLTIVMVREVVHARHELVVSTEQRLAARAEHLADRVDES